MGGGEVVGGGGVVLRGAVGHDVGRAGHDRNRRRKGADLPVRFARRRGDGDGPELDAGGVPQVQDTRVGVGGIGRAAEITQLGDGARDVRCEPHAELVVGRVGCHGRRWLVGRAEDVRAGAVLGPVGDGDGDRLGDRRRDAVADADRQVVDVVGARVGRSLIVRRGDEAQQAGLGVDGEEFGVDPAGDGVGERVGVGVGRGDRTDGQPVLRRGQRRGRGDDRRAVGDNGGNEGDVDPVVRGVVGRGREAAGRAVGEDAAGDAGGQHAIGSGVGGGEVVRGGDVVLRGAVGHDVGRAGLDRDRRREGADLPARFARGRSDGDRPEQDAGGVPQVQDARVGVARVRRAAEVAQLGDGARGVRREPHAELVVGRVGCHGRRRRVGRVEDVRASAVLVPIGDGDGDRLGDGRRDAVADADRQVVDVVGARVGRGLEVRRVDEAQQAGLRRRW